MIRNATIEDVPALISLGRLLHEESEYRDLPYDVEKITGVAHRLLEDGFLRVYEKDGELLGGMSAVITEFWFSHEKVAADVAVFVKPDRRGGIVAAALVRQFIEWAEERGVARQRLSITTGINEEQTAELYENLGFRKCGQIHERRSA